MLESHIGTLCVRSCSVICLLLVLLLLRFFIWVVEAPYELWAHLAIGYSSCVRRLDDWLNLFFMLMLRYCILLSIVECAIDQSWNSRNGWRLGGNHRVTVSLRPRNAPQGFSSAIFVRILMWLLLVDGQWLHILILVEVGAGTYRLCLTKHAWFHVDELGR